jgi:hypothetical protein
MPSYGTLRRVGLVRTDVSEVSIAPIIKLTRICELGKTLAVASNGSSLRKNNLMMNATHSSETPVVIIVTRRNIPENVDIVTLIFRHLDFKEVGMCQCYESSPVSPIS